MKLDFSTFKNSLVLEVLYAVGFSIIGAIINMVGKLPILGMKSILSCLLIFLNTFIFTVFIFVGCGITGIVITFVSIQASVILYVILLCCGLSIAVVNAATVDLYPTNLRYVGFFSKIQKCFAH